MAVKKVVSEAQLGYNVLYDAQKDKLVINIDANTIVTDDNGVLSVDASKLGIVSDDEGNIISVGSDSGAMLTKDTIKSIVGEMVAGAADGLDYDAVTETLAAYLASFAVEDSSTVDLTFIEDANGDGSNGDGKLKADVKVSADAGNAIGVKSDGLFAEDKDVTNGSALDTSTPKFTVQIGSDAKDFTLVELQDLDGNHIGYAFS